MVVDTRDNSLSPQRHRDCVTELIPGQRLGQEVYFSKVVREGLCPKGTWLGVKEQNKGLAGLRLCRR